MRPSNRPRRAWFPVAVVALASLFSSGAFAKPVAKEDAAKAVSGWLKQPGHGLKARIGNAVKETAVFNDAAGNPEYFVVYLKPSGFVIVPADDLVEPIIGFCPAGRYVASNKNALGALVMRDIPARLALARAKQPAAALQPRMKSAQGKWAKLMVASGAPAGMIMNPLSSVSDLRVAPLVQTLWSQDVAGDDTDIACYNYYTPPGPNGDENNDPCGCVATAMAQLMYYTWTQDSAFLSNGVGTASFPISADGTPEDAYLLGGNGDGGPYDWAKMVLNPDNNITTAQCEAIGALCYDAGVSVSMEYTSSGSGILSTLPVATALTQVFFYSNAICGGNGYNNIGSGLIGMLNPNLDAGCPCLIAIYGIASGHDVVADGYGYDSSTLYHHLNMGWSGEDNAWYNLPFIDAVNSGADFNEVEQCVYNVYVTGTGEIISGRVLDANDNPVSGATVQAVLSGGGTWKTITNANGIYAFAGVPSASTYTLSATVTGQTYANLTAVTGTSANNNTTSGDVWGNDFTVSTTLGVQSVPMTGLSIGSSTGDGGTTNYLVQGVALGTSVNLSAPTTDPAGYTFSQWTLNGAAQTGGQKSITFAMAGTTTAVAQYVHVIYVNHKAVGANDGSSWANAFVLLQSALDAAAAGDQIWVAAGTYAPTSDYEMGVGPAGYHFEMANGVAIYGGFAGTETLLSQRNWTKNVTTLTGQGKCYHVFYHDNSFNGLTLDDTAVLDGFTITGADATGSSYNGVPDLSDGGGMYNDACSPTVTNCTFIGNWATGYGGGMENWYSGPTVTNCAFSGDSAGAAGGGMDNEESFPTATNCTFTGNSSATGVGGGMDNWYSTPTLLNCTFSGNSASAGGGMYNDSYSIPTATNCILWDDSSMSGPEVYNTDSTSTPAFGFCDINGCGGSGAGWNNSIGTDSGGNIAANPLFVNAAGGNFQLSPASPCINSADGLLAPATDIDGNPPHDDPGMPNVGIGPPWADMGAYEFQGTTCYLSVQSAPMTGLSIGSSTGENGVTSYTDIVAYGASVNLQAPATNPAGYAFSEWTVNGAAQTAGQKAITFAMPLTATAVAQYTPIYALSVQSTPPTGILITSGTADGGTTNYTVPGVAYGASANLQAPATDPAGYLFLQWAMNGVAQTAGQKSIAFTMTAAVTAVAQYTPIYALSVQSTPPTGLSIGSSAGYSGATNYTDTVVYDTSVDLEAPATGPAGYTFSQWTVNGAAQSPGEKSVTFTMDGAVTAVALYTANVGYTLSVQSTPPTGLSIGSSTGCCGTTNCTMPGVCCGSSVNVQAPAADPAGYTFSQWMVNGAAQIPGQKSITFTMDGAVTAVAHYMPNIGYTLTVQSTPPTGLSVGSSTGQNGTTNYTVPGVGYDASVNLQAPATDPAGYTFSEWTVDGAAQSAGQKSIAFTMDSAATAVAHYTANAGYALTVQSTPPAKQLISSSTGQGGTTNYTVPGVGYDASVNVAAPATDPAGYTFSQWTLNGAAQSDGQKSITFTMDAAVTAVARYTANIGYTLTVQSTPPVKQVITSSSLDGGMTNYTVPDVMYGTSVNVQAPATDPAGYTFSQWTINGAAQSPGQKSVTFTMDAAITAVAEYTANAGYALTVESTPPTGLGISSGTGQGGTTDYTKAGVADETSVNLEAPATDPAGYTFSQWTVNGAAQSPGQKSVTFTMDGAVTAVAEYTANAGYALAVESTPPTGLSVGSGTGQNGTTNYTKSGVAYGASVNLEAPATDPAGYTFSQWTLNGAAQSAGQKSVTFTMDGAMTAVAQYTLNGYALTVESTPPTGLSIGSSTGQKGTTNYYLNKNVASGASVNLTAPATDPSGYTFLQWTVNGTAQTAGQKSITFTMDGDMTAVAQYTLNGYALTVQSTPPTGLSIGSSSGQDGTTNYTMTGIADGTSVNLEAPATDPAGYTFSQWTVNGAAQSDGQKSVAFTMDAAVTAVAHYTANVVYTLTVQSTPPTGLSIGSSTGQNGTTNYTVPGIGYGASVNVEAPDTDPAGYAFSQWTVNGAAQPDGQKSVTLTMDAAMTAVAHYTANVGYALTVQSTPPTGQVITSSTSDGGITNYTVRGVTYGTSVNLQAPATDPSGYTFSQWTVNGAAQSPGQKSIAFTMDGATTAAEYTPNIGYTLTVESTPPTGLSIGSSTGQSGTTNYTRSGVGNGTSVNLQAPATDPKGYTFSQWTVNGAAQSPGQKSVAFTMDGAMTAVAEYTANAVYTLTVQSTPPTGLVIGSSTGQSGTTNCTKSGVVNGTSVNLQAPATDPKGYTFSQWTVDGAAQSPGQKSVAFTMDGAMTAAAEYTANVVYTLTVQSTPPTGLVIGSSTGQNGTTNYTKTKIAYGASVNLEAPATGPAGYTFSHWTVDGAAQTPGQKSVTFTMDGAVTAVAEYTVNAVYTLTVKSTPPTGLSIGSSTGQSGKTNYTKTGIAYGASVNLQAPATDPTGYTFLQWTVNGAAQTAGQKSVTFTMTAVTTAAAVYVKNAP